VLLVSKLLKVVPAERWTMLIADRVFIGKDSCRFLAERAFVGAYGSKGTPH